MGKLPMDLHSHSIHSMDGNNTAAEMCAAAFAAGVEIYAITDHCDVDCWERYDLAKACLLYTSPDDRLCRQSG